MLSVVGESLEPIDSKHERWEKMDGPKDGGRRLTYRPLSGIE